MGRSMEVGMSTRAEATIPYVGKFLEPKIYESSHFGRGAEFFVYEIL